MSAVRFGSDGWVGRFEEDFSDEAVRSIAESLGLLLSEEAEGSTVYVGYDTRRGARRHAELVAGCLAASGLRAVLSQDPCPTPAVGWTVARDDDACAGVVVTASNRPGDCQGVLFRMQDGSRPTGDVIRRLEDLVPGEPSLESAPFETCDLMAPYLAALAEAVDADAIRAAGLRVVVDPLYGAGSGWLAGLLRDLGCEVDEIHAAEADGDYHGFSPDPCEPWVDGCQQRVRSTDACAGFVLDGDGDRSGAIDADGAFLAPARMVPLVLRHLVEGRGAAGRVVATVSSSALVRRMAERLGCPLTVVPIGFRNIYEEMCGGDVVCGVEEYGGVAIPDHLMERDGLLSVMLLVELMATTGKSLAELVAETEAELGRMEYRRVDIRIEVGTIQSLRNVLPGVNPPEVCGMVPEAVRHVDGLYLRFGDGSWMLMRPSRTEPVVRVYGEAPTVAARDALVSAGCAICRAGGMPEDEEESDE